MQQNRSWRRGPGAGGRASIGRTIFALGLAGLLAACGGGSSAPTVSVSCGGSLALSGAQSVDVTPDAARGGTILQFPDPVNAGRTGTMPIPSGSRCTIAPTRNVGG